MLQTAEGGVVSETDPEEYRFSKLTGKYKHYCLEYDGLAIDETCEEFKYCICFKEDKP